MRRTPLTRFLTWSALAWGGLGCGNSGPKDLPKPEALQDRAALVHFEGDNACAALESYLEDTAVLQMRSQLEQAKNGWGYGGAVPMRGAEEAASAPAADSAGAGGPSAYTTTNTQVAGVDEADFVKNDGTRIFVLSGNTLYANRSWPAESLATVGTLKIEGWPTAMFLGENDRLVVYSNVYVPYAFADKLAGIACDSMSCGYQHANTAKITVVDVKDLAHPRVVQQVHLPGQYANARRVGNAVRTVTTDSFRFPENVRWYPEYRPGLFDDKSALAREYDKLIAENEKLIRAQALNDWLPASEVIAEDGTSTQLPIDCQKFYRSNAPSQLGVVTVSTLDLGAAAAPSALDRTSVLAQVGEVYASKNTLYLANQHWWWWPEPGQLDATYLHAFDLSQPGSTRYLGSGRADGHIKDQFSMDEDEQGYFRIATTLSWRVEDKDMPWGRVETANRVSVLALRDGALEVVGKTPDLARGERIFSARFLGKRGFVTTFRQVDPLFAIDLSDPTNPVVKGELKFPGFSTYLHPVDENHLLGIGSYVPENGDWRARALQLALYDISDLAAPKQTFTQLVGTAYSYSEAAYDHHAFNYFPEKKLLAIPFVDWSPVFNGSGDYWGSFVSELKVFSVDVGQGFTARGALSMKDLYVSERFDGWTYYWQPNVRRSVMADDVVYAISDAGIRAAKLESLRTPLATARFQRSQE